MLISDLKLLLRFDTDSIFEEVSQTDISVLGTSTTPIVSSSGYSMQDDQYLFGDGLSSNGYNLSISNSLTIGFWLYSFNPGLAANSATGGLSSIEMPLLNVVDTSSSMIPIIEITEHTSETGNNYIKVNRENEYSASSEEYSAPAWHYFWITFNNNSLRIYIDGLEHVLQNETGNLPSSVDVSLLNLYINHSLDGYSWNISKNKGIIDDIFIFNIADNAESNIQRSINDGIDFIIDDNFTDTYVDKYSIYFNDPETISNTSLIDDLSYVFVGRNDGKIMRGSPSFWETRRSFSNEDELSSLGLDSSSLDNGFLKLTNTTIRL